MHIDLATTIALFSGVGIPFLVDLVTKDVANPKLKAALASGLAILAGVLPTVVYDPHVGWHTYVANVATAFVLAFVTHSTHVTDVVQNATASVGIGKPAAGSNLFISTAAATMPAHTRPAKVKKTAPRKVAKKATPRK